MKVKEKNLQQQVQFWALVGPFISLLTILVSFMKYSPMQYTFATVMIVAIPVCWKWRMRGFAISMGVLMALVAYQFMDMNFDQRIWVGGISLAFSLSLLSTALSFEEISSLMDSMQVESKSRLDSMLRLDEKFKQVSDQYQGEERQLKDKLQEQENEIAQLKNRASASEKLAQVVREELAATHKRNDEILQELYNARNKSSLAERKMIELEEQLAEAAAVPPPASTVELDRLQGEVAALKVCLAKKEDELGLLELQKEYHHEEMQAKEKILQEQLEQLNMMKKAAADQQELIEQLQKSNAEASRSSEEERGDLSSQLQTAHEHLEAMQRHLEEKEGQLQSLKLTVKERDQEFVVERQKLEEEQQRAAEQELVLHKLLEEGKVEHDRLQNQLKTVEDELVAVKTELSSLQEEMISQSKKDPSEKKVSKKETSALRQAEGRYKQLKQQFDEKSLVLDETRRALFHMQEDLLNLQRESEERKITEKSEVESVLEQHIKKMEEERRQLESEHQQEIDDLHEIIASLSKKK